MLQGVEEETRGPTKAMSSWLATTNLDDVPKPVVERAKVLLLDGLGCGLLASRLPWSERAVASILELEGEGSGSIWGWDESVPASAATLLNGTFVQGFELDDYHPFGPLHSESCVIPPIFSLAEARGGVNGREFLEACALGFEVGPRVGITLGGLNLVSRGFHCGPIFGTLAAAAGAGKLVSLDETGFEDALGIAATQSSGLMSAQYEAMVKRMHSGFAARAGLYAATLARNGYSGIKRVVEREYGGLASTFSCGDPTDLGALTRRLGDSWEIDRIAIKPPYSCMGGLHSTIDGIRELQERGPFSAAEVAHIDIWVPHAMFHHGGWDLEPPAEVIGAQMNIGYAAAITILDGDAFVPQFTPDRIGQDDVWALLERVRLHWDEEMDQLGPEGRWMCRIRVELGDGSTREVERRSPWGGVERPMTNEETIVKFRRMAQLVMAESRSRKIEDIVMGIENVDDVGELVGLVKGRVESPF